MTADHGGARLTGKDEAGWRSSIAGRVADVHKTLASASKIAAAGSSAWITGDGGWLIRSDSALAWKIGKMVDKESRKSKCDMIPLYLENGVYNFYLEMSLPGTGVEVSDERGHWRPSKQHAWLDDGSSGARTTWAGGFAENTAGCRLAENGSGFRGQPRA